MLSKKLAAVVSLCVFLSGIASTSFGFDRNISTYSDIDGGAYSGVSDQAFGLELRGLFNSSTFKVESAGLSAVTYNPYSVSLENQMVNNDVNSLFSLHDGYYTHRLPLMTFGDVKYPGIGNMLATWSAHDFDLQFAWKAAFADVGFSTGYIIAAAAVGTGAAVAVASSSSSSSDDSSSGSTSKSGSSDSDDTGTTDNDDRDGHDDDDDHDDDHDDDNDDDHKDDNDDDHDDDKEDDDDHK